MDLIAVILAAPDTKTRFKEAAKLLNYGFANSIYVDDNKDIDLEPVKVNKGVLDYVNGHIKDKFSIYVQNRSAGKYQERSCAL